MLFGHDDVFVNVLAALVKLGPGLFLMPGDGRTALQPLWVDDLTTCMEWSLAAASFLNQVISVGGPEFITLRGMAEIVMEALRVRRMIVPVRPVYLRGAAWFLEQLLPRSPLTTHWLDYLAISRTCELTSVTRQLRTRTGALFGQLNRLPSPQALAARAGPLLRRQLSCRRCRPRLIPDKSP